MAFHPQKSPTFYMWHLLQERLEIWHFLLGGARCHVSCKECKWGKLTNSSPAKIRPSVIWFIVILNIDTYNMFFLNRGGPTHHGFFSWCRLLLDTTIYPRPWIIRRYPFGTCLLCIHFFHHHHLFVGSSKKLKEEQLLLRQGLGRMMWTVSLLGWVWAKMSST